MTLADMCPHRLDELVDAVAAMAAKHHGEITGLLAGGTESLVAAARSRSGIPFVVKGTADVTAAGAEAQLFTSGVPSPELYDLDPGTGVLAMEHIDGAPVCATAPGDPAGELARLRDLLDTVAAAELCTSGLDGFAATIATRLGRYRRTCEAAGRPDLAVWADRVAELAGEAWVPLDLHPKNILVDRTGAWRLIDPMPTRFVLQWCVAKWAVVRRVPGTYAGTSLAAFAAHLRPDEAALMVGTAVWEIGSQRDPLRAEALLELIDATADRAVAR